MKRERDKVGGRTAEIQRLLGRGLRAAVDFGALGEQTIMIDCDVIQPMAAHALPLSLALM